MNSSHVIHVAAAILTDALGRVLLTRRTDGRDLAGLWEFPGGKLEAGESVEQALRRELREELGIEIGASAPLIAVPHAYPHKRILLDVQRVESFAGRPHGRESQAMAWVSPEKLASYAMPAADRPVVAALRQPDLYLITPEPEPEGDDDVRFLASLQLALASGIRRVQLRAKSLPRDRLYVLATAARELTQKHGAELLLNSGHVASREVAATLDLGLHLTAAHLREVTQRPPCRLAASCHDAEELHRAESLGCDFVVLGPVAPTATHPDRAALRWSGFAALREQVALPIYALGGMNVDDLSAARAHGAQGLAAIRSLWPLTTAANPSGG